MPIEVPAVPLQPPRLFLSFQGTPHLAQGDAGEKGVKWVVLVRRGSVVEKEPLEASPHPDVHVEPEPVGPRDFIAIGAADNVLVTERASGSAVGDGESVGGDLEPLLA